MAIKSSDAFKAMDKTGLTKDKIKDGQGTVRIFKLESYISDIHIKKTTNQLIRAMTMIGEAIIGQKKKEDLWKE